jgi:hypothetical protein
MKFLHWASRNGIVRPTRKDKALVLTLGVAVQSVRRESDVYPGLLASAADRSQ